MPSSAKVVSLISSAKVGEHFCIFFYNSKISIVGQTVPRVPINSKSVLPLRMFPEKLKVALFWRDLDSCLRATQSRHSVSLNTFRPLLTISEVQNIVL